MQSLRQHSRKGVACYSHEFQIQRHASSVKIVDFVIENLDEENRGFVTSNADSNEEVFVTVMLGEFFGFEAQRRRLRIRHVCRRVSMSDANQ